MSRYSDWRSRVDESEVYSERPVIERTFYRRDNKLRAEGFLEFEREHFNTARIDSSGMRAMRRERVSWLNRARAEGIDAEEWEERIKRKYRRRGWRFPPHSSLAGRFDPWQQLEHIKERRLLKTTPTVKHKGSNFDGDELMKRLRRG